MGTLFFQILACTVLYYVDGTRGTHVYELPELAYMNTSADPCENFYEYTCGNFQNVNPKPENAPVWDNFAILKQELDELFQVILSSETRSNDPVALKMTKAAYRACSDTNYADKLNVFELGIFKEAGNWPLLTDDGDFTWATVGNLIATYGVQLFFQIEVTPNIFNSQENIIYISRDRILNPAFRQELREPSEDYLNAPLHLRTAIHPFEIFLTKVALYLKTHVGSFKDNKIIIKEISEIFEFSKDLQKGGILNPSYRGTFVSKTVRELQEWTDLEIGTEINLNWLEYLNHIFSKTGVKVSANTTIMIMDLSTFYGVLQLVKQTDKKMLKNFALTRILTYSAPDSNNAIREAYDQFRIQMGDTIYSRSHYCVRKVLDMDYIGFSFALAYEYQRYHFNPNKLLNALEMMKDLYTAFDEILYESDWLDSETRESALAKAQNMITLLGLPNFVTNTTQLNTYYENVRICQWDHFGNSQRIRSFRLASNLVLIGTPRNREIWQRSPLDVNAYYNAQHNRIIVPITILNPVFYTGTIRAVDYGRIGVILGHEITHGFDNQGMMYDSEGTFSPGWWSPDTIKEFNNRTECFKEQYSKYYIKELDKYVDAIASLRENLADNGGLREAYKALQKQKERSAIPLETVKSFTPEQLFFIGFGTMWCTTQTKQYLEKIYSSYAPAKFRVIGAISNNREFADAFNCTVGSKMNPENKCILW